LTDVTRKCWDCLTAASSQAVDADKISACVKKAVDMYSGKLVIHTALLQKKTFPMLLVIGDDSMEAVKCVGEAVQALRIMSSSIAVPGKEHLPTFMELLSASIPTNTTSHAVRSKCFQSATLFSHAGLAPASTVEFQLTPKAGLQAAANFVEILQLSSLGSPFASVLKKVLCGFVELAEQPATLSVFSRLSDADVEQVTSFLKSFKQLVRVHLSALRPDAIESATAGQRALEFVIVSMLLVLCRVLLCLVIDFSRFGFMLRSVVCVSFRFSLMCFEGAADRPEMKQILLGLLDVAMKHNFTITKNISSWVSGCCKNGSASAVKLKPYMDVLADREKSIVRLAEHVQSLPSQEAHGSNDIDEQEQPIKNTLQPPQTHKQIPTNS
jgi:hypothetical protein